MRSGKKDKLQVRPRFKGDDYDAGGDWAFAFELLLGDEFGKAVACGESGAEIQANDRPPVFLSNGAKETAKTG